jgi:hypothetical protein
MQEGARPTLKEALLASEPRFEGGISTLRRGRLRRRAPTVLE